MPKRSILAYRNVIVEPVKVRTLREDTAGPQRKRCVSKAAGGNLQGRVQANAGLMENEFGDSSAFNLLKYIHGLVGATMLIFPKVFVETVYAATPTMFVFGLVMIMGSVHLYAALFNHTLVSASEHGRLSSDTYKRLSGGLAAWALLEIVCSPLFKVQMIQPFFYMFLAIHAVTFAIQAKFSEGLIMDFKLWNVFPLLSLENLYGLCALTVPFAAGAVFLQKFAPTSFLGAQLGSLHWVTAVAGSLGWDFIQAISIGGVLLYSAFVTLLDASQRGRLGASTFKQLNLGVGLISVVWTVFLCKLYFDGYIVIPSLFSPYLSHLMDIFTMKISVFFPIAGVICIWQWYHAKK